MCWARRSWLAPAAKQLEEHAQRLFTEQRALAVFAGLRVAIACAASLQSAGKQLERGSADEPARLPLGLQQASGSWTQCRHQTAPPRRHCFGSGLPCRSSGPASVAAFWGSFWDSFWGAFAAFTLGKLWESFGVVGQLLGEPDFFGEAFSRPTALGGRARARCGVRRWL